MRLYNYLKEAFKSEIEYRKVTENSEEIEIEFEYMDTTFVVFFEKKNFEEIYSSSDIESEVKEELDVEEIGDIWEVNFEDKSAGYSITGKFGKEALKIFSFVFNIIKDIVKERNIKYITTSAHTSEKSRIKLYNRFMKSYSKEYTTFNFNQFIVFVAKL